MLTEKLISLFKDTARKLTGSDKRAFMARVTQTYFDSSARKVESYLGWSRHSVSQGMKEVETGFICLDNYSGRGRKKTTDHLPMLKADICDLVEGQTQVDPTFRSTLRYARISARAVREALIAEKGYRDEDLPSRQTIGTILNQLGYRLKKTQKTKPVKKIKETDAIFEHVHEANQASDQDPKSLRLSIDCKAKVKIGNLSRGGKDRTKESRKADDHDTEVAAVLVPFGILDVLGNEVTIYFGQSHETSDFIVDCLELWWSENVHHYPGVEELAVNLDNGPSIESHRTQFIKRMVEFSHKTNLRIKLIYYPPYHSKYNPIERCWANLENYWNGAILSSVNIALEWASNMKWKGHAPIIHLIEGIYEKGVKVAQKVLDELKQFWQRSKTLPKWDVVIQPS
jgi:hypothetical protein